MMDSDEPIAMPRSMRAIKIDPDHRSVELIEVAPEAVAEVLHSALTETLDFEGEHCLVIDDGSPIAEHPTRFRFANGPVHRPFFGSALILGVASGNWAPATMNARRLKTRIIWEAWDRRKQRYARPTTVKD